MSASEKLRALDEQDTAHRYHDAEVGLALTEALPQIRAVMDRLEAYDGEDAFAFADVLAALDEALP